jgi:hypothetical protein
MMTTNQDLLLIDKPKGKSQLKGEDKKNQNHDAQNKLQCNNKK